MGRLLLSRPQINPLPFPNQRLSKEPTPPPIPLPRQVFRPVPSFVIYTFFRPASFINYAFSTMLIPNLSLPTPFIASHLKKKQPLQPPTHPFPPSPLKSANHFQTLDSPSPGTPTMCTCYLFIYLLLVRRLVMIFLLFLSTSQPSLARAL